MNSERGFSRREVITAAVGAAASAASSAVAQQSPRPHQSGRAAPRKALMFSMLPNLPSLDEKFRLVREVGFEAVEVPPITDPAECERMRKAADSAQVRIHSVIFGGWGTPLSSADPDVIRRGLESVEAALRGAALMGADGLLLVPAVVNGKTRYVDAYRRSQANIRRLIGAAARHKVAILIENVWNNFLLSPLEFARYIDEFKSQWVQAYFDCGNVVAFGWPEDWIRTLGPRIRKIHLKDYRGGPGLGSRGEFVGLREGSINWPEVRRALDEIGFAGYMTPELGGGDAAYLREVSARIDKILAGE